MYRFAVLVFPQAGATDADLCGSLEHDKDYRSGQSLGVRRNVHEPEICCEACEANPQCKAWTWGFEYAGQKRPSACYMKSEAPQENQKFHVAKLVSGLPARSAASSAPASKDTPHAAIAAINVEESDATPAPTVSPAQQLLSKTSASSGAKCAKIEQDTDYQSGVGLTVTPGVHAAE